MKNLVELLDATLIAVHLTELQGWSLLLNPEPARCLREPLSITARPSDAIALAVRTHSNILATEELLNEVGVEIPQGEGEKPRG
jgi:bifunctional DNase/RNase